MNNRVFYLPSATVALRHARQVLLQRGCSVSDIPCSDVTHLLLGVPSLEPDGQLKGGGLLADILHSLPGDVTVMGGNLDVPLLNDHPTVDFLKNEQYLWENAAITADCAVPIARTKLNRTWLGCPVLILGWGRIGKHLAKLLHSLGADVTVAARKENDRAMARSLGHSALDIGKLELELTRYRVIFNTVPAMMIPAEKVIHCRPDCIKIDLASAPGIGGSGVIWARGLPGKDAPETSGELIARTAMLAASKKEES